MKLLRMFLSIALGVAVCGAASLHAQTPAQSAVTTPVAAPLSVVVFSDFACPYSAQLFFALEKYERQNPGKLHVTYKQSPLDIHPEAPLAHRAALAAARQGRFDAMAELLYANQKLQDLPALTAYAHQLHLDMGRFRKDMDSSGVAEQLAADLDESRAFGIDSTPTMYLGGKAVIGEQTDETLAAAIATASGLVALRTAAPSVSETAVLEPAVLADLVHAPSAERGNASAPLTIVEFTDFQCPYCKAAVQPMEQFLAAHERDVRWVLRSFPLDFHPDSELANEAALAAGEQGKFWQMHDLLFAHQDALKLPSLRIYAEELHLDMNAFDQALATRRLAGQIAADRALGTRVGVEGTPTFIIDGQSTSGAKSVAELEQLLALHKVPGNRPRVVVADAHEAGPERRISGVEGAALTLTWYTDVRSVQAAAQAELVRSLAAHYDGRIRVVFKTFPVEAHADGRLASAALIAAFSQGKFWPMYDALTAQKDLLDRASVLGIAARLSLDPTAFGNALDAASGSVQEDIDGAQKRGISGAPVIFLNTKRVDGLQREGFYTAIADGELKEAAPVQAGLAVPTPPSH